MGLLTIRKLADRSAGERVRRFDPETGVAYLADPAGDDPAQPAPWPLAGIVLENPPEQTSISTSKVAEGVAEGWIELVGVNVVHRPGGPAADPWRSGSTHTFVQAEEIVFKTVAGPVRYKVVHQPDKYAAEGDDTTKVTPGMYAAGATRVDHFYGLERIDNG